MRSYKGNWQFNKKISNFNKSQRGLKMTIRSCKNCKNLLKVNPEKHICKIAKVDITEIENCIFKD